MNLCTSILILLSSLGTSTPEILDSTPTLSDIQKQIPVWVGIYLLRIPSMSLRNNNFTADFYLWFRWKDESFNPEENFELTNGNIETLILNKDAKVKDEHIITYRVQASITQYWDVSQYPLDHHELPIQIEMKNFEEKEVKFIPDRENCFIDQNFHLTDWTIRGLNADVISYSYVGNFGSTNKPSDQVGVFSRFIFSVILEHRSFYYSFKLLYGVYLATAIAIAALWISPQHSSPRFSLGVGAVFAIIANHFRVAGGLPETSQMTLVDSLHIYAGLIILSSIIASVISLNLWEAGRTTISTKFDRYCIFIMIAVFITLNIRLLL